MKNPLRFILLLLSCPLAAQTYQVGDVVEDFQLTDYRTGADTSLYQLGAEGGVLVLEWFAWWCPFCARASANVETGIIDHYSSSGGNPHGLPVTHLSLNVQGNARNNSDIFIETYGLGTVLEDYQRDFFNKFSPGGGQPLFVVINAEPGSPSAEQWEVLYVRLNYSSNEAPDISALMRPVIDSVMPGVLENPLADQFEELAGPFDGWYESSWFGWFFDAGYPLINHVELGYGYLASAPGSNTIHFHDQELGWLFTGKTAYPFFFSYRTGNWLLYLEGSSGKWFYDYASGGWLDVSQGGFQESV